MPTIESGREKISARLNELVYAIVEFQFEKLSDSDKDKEPDYKTETVKSQRIVRESPETLGYVWAPITERFEHISDSLGNKNVVYEKKTQNATRDVRAK